VELGLLEKLVGVSRWCHRYLRGTKKTVFASVDAADYKCLERMKPEIILTTSGIHRDLALELHSRGYDVFPIPLPNNLFGIISNVQVIGTLVGRQRDARDLAAKLLAEFETAKACTDYEKRPRVYTEIWPEKFSITFGGLAFTNDLIYSAGGCNIFSEKAQDYFKADRVEVARLNPQVIMLLFENPSEMQGIDIRSLMGDRGWSGVEAVRDGKIVTAYQGDLPLTHSGPSFIQALRLVRDKFEDLGFSVK
jgi:ABC-type Fe3+-hydroxamate transport system substrate-binding protein